MSCQHIIKWISSQWGINKLWPLKLVVVVLFWLILWGTTYTIFKDNVSPGSDTFSLAVLIILAYIAGQLLLLIQLPPLFGMILVGFAMANLNIYYIGRNTKKALSILRSIGLVIILAKAGLGMDALVLKRLINIILRMGAVPCLAETVFIMFVGKIILGLPWIWGLLLGFLMAAIAPAVVVPPLQELQKLGYGEDKNIATVLIAASTIDCIITIVGFGISLGITFSENSALMKALRGPIEVFLGIIFGTLWGFLIIHIPHKDLAWVVPARVYMIGCGGMFAVFGSQMIDYGGAGPVANVIAAVIAGTGWKKQGWSKYTPVLRAFSLLWKIFEPIVFASIGTEVIISNLNPDMVTGFAGILFIGLTVRMVVSFGILFGTDLNLREKLFVAGAWIPKATVQAAFGPKAFELVTQRGLVGPVKDYSKLLLDASVIAIMIAAPLGALFITVSSTRLLTKYEKNTDVQGRDSSVVEE